MPRSDFYVLPSADTRAREHFLFRLLEKIIALGHRIYIRTESEAAAAALDSQLWEYSADGFIPHSLVVEDLGSPVEIGYGDALPRHREICLNFALDIPDIALEFERTIEIVVQQPEILAATRRNYRRYQQSGYEIHMNDMRRKN